MSKIFKKKAFKHHKVGDIISANIGFDNQIYHQGVILSTTCLYEGKKDYSSYKVSIDFKTTRLGDYGRPYEAKNELSKYSVKYIKRK